MPTYVPSQCWCEAITRGPPPAHERCMTRPNCRGRGHAIAAWNHLDMDLITQQDAQGHAYGLSQLAQKPLQQAKKHSPSVSGIDSNTWLQIPRSRPHVAVNDMCTPTSAARSRKVYDATALPPGVQSDTLQQYEHNDTAYVFIPSTFSNANEWTQ